MGFAKEGDVWVTLQTHKNVMAIASLKELAAIVLVKGNKPEDDTLEAAIEEGIPILGTDKQTFETSGIIYEMLKNWKLKTESYYLYFEFWILDFLLKKGNLSSPQARSARLPLRAKPETPLERSETPLNTKIISTLTH